MRTVSSSCAKAESEEMPAGPVTRFPMMAVTFGVDGWFPYWSQTHGGSTEPKGIGLAAALTSEGANP